MRTLTFILTVVATLAGNSVGQNLLSFENCPPGPVAGCSAQEPWNASGGNVTVVPQSPIPGPISGFPTNGSQWCIVHSAGATGGFTQPAGGPAQLPYPAGSTGQLKIPITLPTPATFGAPLNVSFDYIFVTPECPGELYLNDCVSVDLTMGGFSVTNLLYVDTFSPFLAAPAVSPNETGQIPPGACQLPSGAGLETTPIGQPVSVNVPIDPTLAGQQVMFEVNVADGGDNAFNSWIYIDNIVIGGSTTPEFQVNQPGASSTINSILGTPLAPAFVNMRTNQPGLLDISSTANGQPWDLAFGTIPPVGASTGGAVLSDGQIINLDLFDPTLSFLWEGFFSPPFVSPQELYPFSSPVPVQVALQSVHADPASLTGVWLSQATWLDLTQNTCEITLTDCPVAFIPEGRLPGSNTGDPGNSVTFTATVTQGGPRKIRFFLENVSDEPGVCLNFGGEADTDKDLKFIQTAGVNPPSVFDPPSPTGQVITTKSPVFTATVTVTCYDWGAFGRIKACCLDAAGTACESFSSIRRIPRDTNGNDIADMAAQNSGPGGASGATDDTDDMPAGEGTNGDHLPRYEEYRGFIILAAGGGMAHQRTDVTRKDVFIRDVNSLGPGDFTTPILTTDVRYVSAALLGPMRRINFKRSSHVLATHQTAIETVDGGAMGGAGSWGVTSCTGVYVPNNLNFCRVYTTTIQSSGASTTMPIAIGAATIPVNSAALYVPANGQFTIGGDTISYTGRTGTTFTGCAGVTAAHAMGSGVSNFVNPADFQARVFAHESGHAVELDHGATVGCGLPPNMSANIMSEFSCPGSVSNMHYWHVFVGVGAGAVNAITGEFRVKP